MYTHFNVGQNWILTAYYLRLRFSFFSKDDHCKKSYFQLKVRGAFVSSSVPSGKAKFQLQKTVQAMLWFEALAMNETYYHSIGGWITSSFL